MCDMQQLPTSDDASCEEDSEMNFASFSAVGSAGTHYVATGGQMPVAKLQQNVSNNPTGMQQVCVAMGDGGVQYMRALDGGAGLQATPQLITVPITLPGANPGDSQPTVQIKVLNPALLQATQQPKYQMQIPIQGFQQGAVLTVAYSPEANESGGLQLVGQGGMGEGGLQLLTSLPPALQLMQAHALEHKEQAPAGMHRVFITPNHQVIIQAPDGDKQQLNNNTSHADNNYTEQDVVVKEECDDNDESSQGTEGDSMQWQASSNQDLVKYISQLPPQYPRDLPVSLQQFLQLNPDEGKKPTIEAELPTVKEEVKKQEPVAEAVLGEDGTLKIQSKKKYKKKPSKPPRPKPGQVVIATALDGTPIFCCPECQMAYPEKEQLEIHLIVHKIDRRFICGLCGAALKRKEHLERHKLGHNPERPYVCGVCRKGFKRREHLNLHAVIHSGVKTEMCTICGKGFYRKDHLRKHTRSHESKRARDEATLETPIEIKPAPPSTPVLPEITIHIPTSTQMPVQINIPQHVVSSLRAAQSQAGAGDVLVGGGQTLVGGGDSDADELLAHHT